MEPLTRVVLDVLESAGWPYTLPEDHQDYQLTSAYMQLRWFHQTFTVVVTASDKLSRVSLCVAHPLRCPDHSVAGSRVVETLNALNDEGLTPGFALGDNGSVTVRQSLDFEGAAVDPRVIENAINGVIDGMRRGYDAIIYAMYSGKTLGAVLAASKKRFDRLEKKEARAEARAQARRARREGSENHEQQRDEAEPGGTGEGA